MAGEDFHHHLAARPAIKPIDIPIARLVDATVDDRRWLQRLGGAQIVVRLLLHQFGQRIDGERHLVGTCSLRSATEIG